MRLLKTENRKISVDELNISDAYQRTIVPARVNRISKNLDQDAFGSLTVGERRDGTFWVVELNMDHPFNREMMTFISTAPPSVVDAFFARMQRRGEFDLAMEQIGGLTKYRRKLVARALVRMFRAGYRSGWSNAWRKASEAADGR
jgi:hypothetical protein